MGWVERGYKVLVEGQLERILWSYGSTKTLMRCGWGGGGQGVVGDEVWVKKGYRMWVGWGWDGWRVDIRCRWRVSWKGSSEATEARRRWYLSGVGGEWV